MPGKFESFDRTRLRLLPLGERSHDFKKDEILPLAPVEVTGDSPFMEVARNIVAARENGASVIFMMGAHVLKTGCQRYVVDLIEKGWLTCIATNGAGVIHDFELALCGSTTESVARYISEGQFGLWSETGRINDIAAAAATEGIGLGEAAGRVIEKESFPYREFSPLAAAWRNDVLFTSHVSIGYDIIHEHPNCDGAALGAASYTDFLRFAKVIESLEGGVVMNFGSAVMAPEVYLKALAMARNVAFQESRTIAHFLTLVCDLRALPPDCSATPSKDDPDYYYRPWKTMLVRTVADGGRSIYLNIDHTLSIPALWTAIDIVSSAGA